MLRTISAALTAACLLQGCAVERFCIDQHPVACAAGLAVIGGAVTYALKRPVSSAPTPVQRPVACSTPACIE